MERQEAIPTQVRPLVESAQEMLGTLVRLLDEHEGLQVQVRRAEEDGNNLRRAISDLKQENENLRSQGETLWKEHQVVLSERNALVKERAMLLEERERISAGLSKFMREVAQPMSAQGSPTIPR